MRSFRKGAFAVQYADWDRAGQSRFSRRAALTGLVAAGALAFGGGRVWGAAPAGALSFLAEAVAAEDGRMLRLADGRRVVLPHILPPGPDRHEAMADTAPIRAAARVLADLALGRVLRVDLSDPAQDRHGRLRARVAVGGADLAESLCAAGMVRVFPEPGAEPDRIAALIGAETRARMTGKGFWSDGYFAVQAADPPDFAVDRFEIVSGIVRKVTPVGDRDHLEFGPDWRIDFTAGLDRSLRRALAARGGPVDTLPGRAVTVRGWLRSWNGPFMEIRDPTGITLP